MPTPRVLLGKRLREARSRAGLTQAAVAAALEIVQSQVSRMETGEGRVPTEQEVRAWLTAAGIPQADHQEFVDLAAAASSDVTDWDALKGQGWTKHQKRYDDLQAEAVEVLVYQSSLIPGLLQAPDYVDHLMREVVGVAPKDIGDAVAGRLRRQEWLYAPDSHLRVIIAEHVLRTPFGGHALMAAQLDRIASLSRLPSVALYVLPTDTEMPEAWNSGFVLYEMPDQADSQVLIELPSGEMRETDPAKVALYRAMAAVYVEHAVTGQGAIQIVQDIAGQMRRPRGDRRHAAQPGPEEGTVRGDS